MNYGRVWFHVFLVSFVPAFQVAAQEAAPVSVGEIDVAASIAAQVADAELDTAGTVRAINIDPVELASIRLPVIAIGTRNPAVRAIPYGLRSLTDSYVMNFTVDGSSLSLTASKLQSDLPPDASYPNVDSLDTAGPCVFSALTEDEEPETETNEKEHAADCSWFRFGASYNLRLFCSTETDVRCMEQDFLQEVARQQIVIKGGE